MQRLTDKLVLFGLCLLALSFTEPHWMFVLVTLAAITVSSLNTYFENKIPLCVCIFYGALCLGIPEFTVFLPLVVYDCAGLEKWIFRLCWVVALPACLMIGGLQFLAVILFVSGIAVLLWYRTSVHLKTQGDFFTLTDDAQERAALLEQKNRDLMEKQDYEIRLATLTERNRIAREIHDNVGHLLTRSLLQIGALRVIRADDSSLSHELELINSTLSDAMDSIRDSVHDLHAESVDLKVQLSHMIQGFAFCPVKLNYDADDLPGPLKYCFAAVTREALSNIAKHSHATEALITVIEHPAFCQLIIEDNGTGGIADAAHTSGEARIFEAVRASKKIFQGMGLLNMADRVDALGGVFRWDDNNGFRIFISVPKEHRP